MKGNKNGLRKEKDGELNIHEVWELWGTVYIPLLRSYSHCRIQDCEKFGNKENNSVVNYSFVVKESSDN